ncbi:hypothetical protein [Sinorhizobium meliloti]|uniref:hypothetical protein n=1 Tax=Rhizobium meliloti TaxID=382 RepID=UPI001F1D0F89
MALEELLAANAVGRSNDRAGPALDVIDEPGSDGFMVAGEIFLGHGFAIAGVRPEWLVGTGDEDAHDLGLGALAPHRSGLGGRPRLGRVGLGGR